MQIIKKLFVILPILKANKQKMADTSANNKRIAKNTLLLYMRMFLLMGITFYTSRVVLNTLGVEDYGVYDVVGGFVALFGIVTSSLSGAIGRFITVELGKGNLQKLRNVFSTSIKVQLIISLIIAVFGEAIGLWFMNTHMQIPEGREVAAQWVLHCSIISFIFSLINVPYSSVIIAHERMSAFAYISILEAGLKLGIVYLLLLFGIDKLILYAILTLSIQIFLRVVLIVYCRKNFAECSGRSTFDKQLFGDIWKFASWNFLGNGAYILNTQGVNMVMNVFFGVIVNASRGIANQVNGAVQQFVNNFMTALGPQIVKSYAAGDKQTAFTLACRGAKFSYLMMYILALPIMMEADQILSLWLGNPPKESASYVIWTLLASITTVTGQTLVTLQMAHGDIKKYQIFITIFGFAPFPLTWIGYELGAPAIWAFIIYFIVYYLLIYVRIWLVHGKTGIPYAMYLKEVILRTHVVSILSLILPLTIVFTMEPTIIRLLLNGAVCLFSTLVATYYLGFTRNERIALTIQLGKLYKKIKGIKS